MRELETWSRVEMERELTRLRARAARIEHGEPAVSGRVLGATLQSMDQLVSAERVDRLLAGAGLDPAGLRATRGWVPWDDFARVLDALRPTGALVAAGRSNVDSPLMGFLAAGAAPLAGLDAVIRWMARVTTGPGGLLLRGTRAELRVVRPDTREIVFSTPPNVTMPAGLAELARGWVERIVELMGGDADRVEVRRDRSTVTLSLPPTRAPTLRRVGAFVTRWSSRNPSRELADARDAVRARNRELTARIAELEESERARGALRRAVDERERMELVGRLAAGVAHDFNNLLTVVSSSCALLEDELEAGAREDLAVIAGAAERAGHICRQLLAVGRVGDLRLERLRLRDVVEARRDLLRATAGETIEVIFDLTTDVSVFADAEQIERILLELVWNARRAMPEGGSLTVRVSDMRADESFATSHPGVHPGSYAWLRVSDRGEGMSEAVRDRAIEPFFSGDGDRPGLGLSSVFGIVRQLGGTLELDSRLGAGTDVDIFLPAVEPV